MYYHDLKVGFNLWFLLVPLLAVLMAFLGSFRYGRTKKGHLSVVKHEKAFKKLESFFAILATSLTALCFLVESHSGYIQWVINQFDGDPSYLWFVIPFDLVVMAAIAYNFFIYASKIGEKIKYKILTYSHYHHR
ncbi:MAG: hypothetical protein Q4A36_00630 [Candidatus Saccharibacteria bacterium]|nr:hypothetical protein [Candidatus Saccharibacteria bacterium]